MKLVSRRLSQSLRPSSVLRSAARGPCRAEPLESRRLLSVSLQPFSNATIAQGSAQQTADLNQAFFDNATGQPDLKFAAQSDNTTVAQAAVDANGTLTITPAPANAGFARITLTATAPDNSEAIQTFRVQVTASADRSLDVPIGPGHHSFRYVMANHTTATITLNGPGSGTIHMGGDNLLQIGDHARGANQEVESITLTGTTAASQLVIIGTSANRGKDFADVGNITSDGSVGQIRVKRLFLDGDINLAGGVGTLNIDAARSGTMTFGQSIGSINLTVGTITNENLSTPAPFGLIHGGNWFSSDSVPESFKAASIGRIVATGNFDVGIQLTGTGAKGQSIGGVNVLGAIGGTWTIPGPSAPLVVGGTAFDWDATFNGALPSINDRGNFGGSMTIASIPSIRVRGTMQNAVLNFTGAGVTDLGAMRVTGMIKNSTINAAGDLGPIAAEALQDSIVYAGVNTSGLSQALPAAASDLSAAASIRSITLVPRANVVGFLGSDIAAASVGTLSLSTTQIANGGVAFGIAAESIGHLLVRDLTTRHFIAINNVHDAATLAAQIAALGFGLQDLNLRILS